MAKARKRNNAARSYIINVFILITASLLIYYTTKYFNRPTFVRYPAFGIDMPVNYPIHGIDVSRYQSSIDWEDVKQMYVKPIKIGFCFIKATEGLSTIDERFRRNWYEAKKAGLPRGAYHFFNPSKSGKVQAMNFIQTVDLEKNDLPPVLDIEQVNGTSKIILQRNIKDWLLLVEKKYHIKPIIYTNVVFYEEVLAGIFDDYPLWVAHYFAKDRPRIKRSWLFWQHNERGHVNGITSQVDFNVFCGDSAEFRKILIQ